MLPRQRTRSASATVLLTSMGVPAAVVPKETNSSDDESRQRMRPQAAPAKFWRSSGVCARWLPRPKTSEISSSRTPPAWSSSSTAGRTCGVGIGRVISLVMMATVSPGRTTSRSRGDSMGSCRARSTSAVPASPKETSLAFSTPRRLASGISHSCVPSPYPTEMRMSLPRVKSGRFRPAIRQRCPGHLPCLRASPRARGRRAGWRAARRWWLAPTVRPNPPAYRRARLWPRCACG